MRIYGLLFVSFILAFCLSSVPTAAKSSNRVALVIGNSEYQVEPLKTPAADAQDISAALSNIGFEVITLTSVTRRELLEGLNNFADKLQSAEVGLFYFAGYAVQMDGVNYLLPLKAAVHSAVDIEYEAIQLNRVFDKMGEVKNQLNIVILDACRRNPFVNVFEKPSQGLAPVEVPPGMIISYAASPGSAVNEGTGENSIFTKHLISALKSKELSVQGWFDTAGAGVQQETNQQQKPWIKSSRIDSIYLVGDRPAKVESAPQPTSSPAKTEVIEESTGRATQSGRLEVTVWPRDAKIRVLNIGPKYKPGMKLPAGRYHIEASRAGYKTLRQWVEIASEEYAEYDLELEEESPGSRATNPSINRPKLAEPNNAIGSTIMDKSDKLQLNNVFEKGRSRQAVTWVNPNSGNAFKVIPQPAFADSPTKKICRVAEISATIAGRPQKTILTACRNAQGQWVVSASEGNSVDGIDMEKEYTGSAAKTSSVYRPKIVESDTASERSGPTSGEAQNETIKDNEGGTTQWAWLNVNPYPHDAKIRVLNIGPKYKPGMKLPTGRYHIEVSKAGYKTVKEWIDLPAEERAMHHIVLDKEQPIPTPKMSGVNQAEVVDPNSTIGKNAMDNSDKQRLNDTFESGRSGKTVSWANPNSGNNFEVTPWPASLNRSKNAICRTAEILANIGGQTDKNTIMLCRNPEGKWVNK